jgi:hypothetical protein
MLRATLLLVALCAVVSVNGLGFLNSGLLPEDLLDSGNTAVNEARLRLFRDLIFTPTNVATALPLGNGVLIENYQANNVDPFNAASAYRSSLWFNPVAFNSAASTGVVVALGPDVQQRSLLREGQRVIYANGGQKIQLNGIVYSLVTENNVLGALDIGSGSAAAQRFSAYVNQANTIFTPTQTVNQLVRADATFI